MQHLQAVSFQYHSRYTSDDLLHSRDAAVCTGAFSSDEVVIGMALAYSRRAFAFAIMVTVGIAFEKNISGDRSHESVHDQYDLRIRDQYRAGSVDDLRHRAVSADGDFGCCLCNGDRADGGTAGIPGRICRRLAIGSGESEKTGMGSQAYDSSLRCRDTCDA